MPSDGLSGGEVDKGSEVAKAFAGYVNVCDIRNPDRIEFLSGKLSLHKIGAGLICFHPGMRLKPANGLAVDVVRTHDATDSVPAYRKARVAAYDCFSQPDHAVAVPGFLRSIHNQWKQYTFLLFADRKMFRDALVVIGAFIQQKCAPDY